MGKKLFIVTLILIGGLSATEPLSARKIKHSLTIDKESKSKAHKKGTLSGMEIPVDSVMTTSDSSLGNFQEIESEVVNRLKECSFSGYDKEANSNLESFILLNNSGKVITGYKVRIDYLDMQGRMLHSRIVEEGCRVPAGENRRLDIKSWDTQHTYYYYLGNAPRRVATPYQVKFTPLSFWIE